MFVDRIDSQRAEAVVEHLRASAASMAVTQIRVLGGAIARVPVDATAYAHRQQGVLVNVAAVFDHPEDSPVHEAWVTRFAATLSDGTPGVYLNFLGDEGDARVHEAYPEATWRRLAAIKARYDPTNLFRFNHNVPPDFASLDPQARRQNRFRRSYGGLSNGSLGDRSFSDHFSD